MFLWNVRPLFCRISLCNLCSCNNNSFSNICISNSSFFNRVLKICISISLFNLKSSVIHSASLIFDSVNMSNCDILDVILPSFFLYGLSCLLSFLNLYWSFKTHWFLLEVEYLFYVLIFVLRMCSVHLCLVFVHCSS